MNVLVGTLCFESPSTFQSQHYAGVLDPVSERFSLPRIEYSSVDRFPIFQTFRVTAHMDWIFRTADLYQC